MKSFSLLLFFLAPFFMHAQNRLEIKVVDHEQNPIAGVQILLGIEQRAVTDSTGTAVFTSLASGTYELEFNKEGFETVSKDVTIPFQNGILQVELEEEEHEEEVIVEATRTSRTIENSPTRVEVISGEELEEKGNMKPGDIRMLLNESTGIQVQQTSATSGNASIRIQGLDGRYTQILRDGLPLYGGYSGGFSLLQTVPLDLKQVEVIKGSTSTLYGGGAIAGLVNLVSRTPSDERQLNFMANATSGSGLDLSGFYSKQFKEWGTTIFASRNSNSEFDPGKTGFSSIPRFERYTIHPKVFYEQERFSGEAGFSYITEDRLGGSMSYLKDPTLPDYFEENNTDRIGFHSKLRQQLSEHASLQFKASYNHFDRRLTTNSTRFGGIQRSVFTELTWNNKGEKTEWVAGLNYLSDDFEEEPLSSAILRDYNLSTVGAFVQNTLQLTNKLTVESGLRGDHVSDYGFEVLPRISMMFRATPSITTRIGGGLGYKSPTIFNDESERYQFRFLYPTNPDVAYNERSAGLNGDINFSFRTGNVQWSVNQLLFYTVINDPLHVFFTSPVSWEYRNAEGKIESKGGETNIKAILGHFKLFVGYTFVDAERKLFNTSEQEWLTARHRLNNVLMYEIHESLKLGLEAYYIGEQRLPDGTKGNSYWITGFMAEKIWEKFSVFINFENFTDTRQSKWGPIYSGPYQNPVFKDVYAPLEGFVFNSGLKIRL